MSVSTGLDVLNIDISNNYKGNIGYVCHGASIDKNLNHGLSSMIKKFGNQLTKVFSPQHGFVGDVQDNMIESDHFFHPYFQRKIYSLYSDTRIPTDEMLEDLDCIFVDLQDVGTRIYTYIYTLTLLMKKCADKDIKVIVLDRPNPINAKAIEGNILDINYASFVGLHPIPVRHGLTIGEVALLANKYYQKECSLEVVKMQGYERSMSFEDTKLPWVIPSPNLPTIDAAYSFVGSVLFEGTNISEGRGTTKALEFLGHPNIEPYSFLENITPKFKDFDLEGFILRPIVFKPTFQKHQGIPCGGYQIHVTDRNIFKPWRLCQFLLKEIQKEIGDAFGWKSPPYEYEEKIMPVHLINGTEDLYKWYMKDGNFDELTEIEFNHREKYLNQRDNILLYK
jgi:uncharacterized protein YbbC (DUF1343 family)